MKKFIVNYDYLGVNYSVTIYKPTEKEAMEEFNFFFKEAEFNSIIEDETYSRKEWKSIVIREKGQSGHYSQSGYSKYNDR